MMKFAIQAAITLAVSIVLVQLIGWAAYAGVGAFIFLVALGLFYSRHGMIDNDENAPGAVWMLMTVGSALIVATFWAVLMLAWSWHGPMARVIARSRGDEDDDEEPENGGKPGA